MSCVTTEKSRIGVENVKVTVMTRVPLVRSVVRPAKIPPKTRSRLVASGPVINVPIAGICVFAMAVELRPFCAIATEKGSEAPALLTAV